MVFLTYHGGGSRQMPRCYLVNSSVILVGSLFLFKQARFFALNCREVAETCAIVSASINSRGVQGGSLHGIDSGLLSLEMLHKVSKVLHCRNLALRPEETPCLQDSSQHPGFQEVSIPTKHPVRTSRGGRDGGKDETQTQRQAASLSTG